MLSPYYILRISWESSPKGVTTKSRALSRQQYNNQLWSVLAELFLQLQLNKFGVFAVKLNKWGIIITFDHSSCDESAIGAWLRSSRTSGLRTSRVLLTHLSQQRYRSSVLHYIIFSIMYTNKSKKAFTTR